MSTTLLLHFEGADNSTTFTDSSATGLTVAPQGSAKISTTEAKFTAASGYFNGTTDHLTIAPAGGAWAFGTGDWTAEAWVDIKTLASPTTHLFGDQNWTAGTSPGWFVGVEASGALTMYCYASGSIWTTAQSAAGLISITSGFVHIATSREAGVQRLFLNGVVVASIANTYDYLGANNFRVGSRRSDGTDNYFLHGYVDELRVTNGVSLYGASGFTPPTAPFNWSSAAVSPPVGIVAAYSGIHASLTAPSPVFYAGPAEYAIAALTPPSPTAKAYSGAEVNATSPSPRLSAQLHDSSGENAAYLTSPPPGLTITTGANSRNTAPRAALASTGTVVIMSTASLHAPKPAFSAVATTSAMATAALSAPRPNLIGYSGAVCSVSVTGKPTLAAAGTTGGVGGAQVTCPLFQLSASATAQNRGGANLLSPSPRLGAQAQAWLVAPSAKLTAIGTAVVTATYEAYAVNLKHSDPNANDEITRYTNFPFTHVVRHKNSYYGVNSTGLYLLEGTTDDATPIPWAVKTAMTDFKSPEKKTVASAYFGGRFGPASTVQLHAGEQTPNTYSFATPRDDLAQNHRQVFGKGLKERYFALGASGTGVCEIDSIELDVRKTNRRI